MPVCCFDPGCIVDQFAFDAPVLCQYQQTACRGFPRIGCDQVNRMPLQEAIARSVFGIQIAGRDELLCSRRVQTRRLVQQNRDRFDRLQLGIRHQLDLLLRKHPKAGFFDQLPIHFYPSAFNVLSGFGAGTGRQFSDTFDEAMLS